MREKTQPTLLGLLGVFPTFKQQYCVIGRVAPIEWDFQSSIDSCAASKQRGTILSLHQHRLH
jgi:hypothetical protein